MCAVDTVLCFRFVDRDGDGYISADDIFAVQAMLMQRSEIFLRVSTALHCTLLLFHCCASRCINCACAVSCTTLPAVVTGLTVRPHRCNVFCHPFNLPTYIQSIQQIAFRVYTESLWYPGRQFNLINAKQQIPRKSLVDMSSSGGAGSSAGTSSTGGTPIKMTP